MKRRSIIGLLLIACCANGPAAGAVESEPVFESITVTNTRFDLQFAPGLDASARLETRQWIERSSRVVSDYFGGFPVPSVTILVISGAGAGVSSGAAFADPELRIRVRIGRDTGRDIFLADWIMVHEMVHLAIPAVPENQNWFHEGVATYVEIVSRAQAGLSGRNGGWSQLVRNLHQGLPQEGDRGLDHTPTWGRTYWGGALFCLLADVALRKRSNNRIGLQDALRGVVAGGGNFSKSWPLEHTLRMADAATGYNVLSELHQRMKAEPHPVDLATLWRELGISDNGEGIVLKDDAPLSAVRKAILNRR